MTQEGGSLGAVFRVPQFHGAIMPGAGYGPAVRGNAQAPNGSRVPVRADTLCLHGDTPGAAEIARRIHERFRSEGIRIAPLETGRVSRREGFLIPPG